MIGGIAIAANRRNRMGMRLAAVNYSDAIPPTPEPSRDPAGFFLLGAGYCRPLLPRMDLAVPTLNWIGKDAVVKHHKDVPNEKRPRRPFET